MLDTYFQTSLGHIASSLHELYSVLRLASFGPLQTKLPLITPTRVQAFCGRVRPHGFRNILDGVLGTLEGGRVRFETHEPGVLGFSNTFSAL